MEWQNPGKHQMTRSMAAAHLKQMNHKTDAATLPLYFPPMFMPPFAYRRGKVRAEAGPAGDVTHPQAYLSQSPGQQVSWAGCGPGDAGPFSFESAQLK